MAARPVPFGQPQDDVLNAIRDLERRNPMHAEELRDHFLDGMTRKIADEIENAGGAPARWQQPLTGGLRPASVTALGEALPGAPIARRSNPASAACGVSPCHIQPGRQTPQGVTRVLEDEVRVKKIFTDVWANSKTAERLAAQEDVRQLPSMLAELAAGGVSASGAP